MDRVFSFLSWKQGWKKRGSTTCRTDRANEANKMFIIWLCWLFRFWKGDREPEVHTAAYGPGIDQSQHAKSVSHIIKSSTSSQPRSQSEVVSLASFHTWSIGAPCFERLWSCCRWFFHFFLRECGFYRFKTNRRSTTTNNKHKYRKQSEMKSQNQESGSKTLGFDLSSSSSSWPFAGFCCCFPCTIGWLVS